MPLYNWKAFEPKGLYKSGHFSTIVPNAFSNSPDINYHRKRLKTSDDDFIDLDYIFNNNDSLAVLCHGLEGHSSSSYIRLFASHLSNLGYDILAMNYRGCSGVMNKKLHMYNSGTTGDLHEAIQHRLEFYSKVVLIGFSLGGNLILKYLGEQKYPVSNKIKAGVAISTPVHLSDASQQLLKWDNYLYQLRFLWSLNRKIIQKQKMYPGKISLKPMWKIRNLWHFDNYYTAPLFGYHDAEDYYAQNQSIQWLHLISVPTLIINAKDDPFLGPKCYPIESAKSLKMVHLILPEFGGHVGFAFSKNDQSWLTTITTSFIDNNN